MTDEYKVSMDGILTTGNDGAASNSDNVRRWLHTQEVKPASNFSVLVVISLNLLYFMISYN